MIARPTRPKLSSFPPFRREATLLGRPRELGEEIAWGGTGFGTASNPKAAVTFSPSMAYRRVLQQNLDEEYATDKKLMAIAESKVNQKAA